MIYEKWDIKFDIDKLNHHLDQFVLPLEPVYQSPSFGGWSVWSSNGSYKDGWHMGHGGISKIMDLESLKKQALARNGKLSGEYKHPTEICHGYLSEVMSQIEHNDLKPSRARIIRLPPGQSCVWHRDAPENVYCVRLHVPIRTNLNCFFEVENENAHLPADGSAYFIKVNRLHRVLNAGETNRYHLVMDVRDTRGITVNHKWIKQV